MKDTDIDPDENHEPNGKHKSKGKTSRLLLLAHLLSFATILVCVPFSLTSCEVRDVAKLSIESNYRLTHRVHGCCDLCPGLNVPLGVIVYCLLEDRYGLVPHVAGVVCQHLRLVVQHSPAVGVVIEPFWEAAHVFCILSVVIVAVGIASLAGWSGRPVGLWCAL